MEIFEKLNTGSNVNSVLKNIARFFFEINFEKQVLLLKKTQV